MTFTLWLEEIYALPARVVLDRVRAAEKKPLEDLRIYDLLREGDRPLLWGVYFFFSQDGNCLYVGKNSARKFVERIPVHLCLNENDWMNHFVKRVKKSEKLVSLTDAAEVARKNTLLLMPVSRKEQTKQLSAVEKFFRLFAEPKYNSLPRRERHNQIDLGAPLNEVLELMLPRTKQTLKGPSILTEPVDCERLDELLRFLPLFENPNKNLDPKWDGLDSPPAEDGVVTFIHPVYPPVVEEFFQLAGQTYWCDYDYERKGAGDMVRSDERIASASLAEIKTMLTFCVRGERICDGHWGALINEGRIVAILRRLGQIRQTRNSAGERG